MCSLFDISFIDHGTLCIILNFSVGFVVGSVLIALSMRR